MATISYRTVDVDGTKIFYREAGERSTSPSFLLLHGYPSASHQFRDLIPLLCDRFHVIAPDFPGFGQSELQTHDHTAYTFAYLAKMITRFTEVMKLERYAMYIFDYGAPVGLRMALMHPERVAAVVSQNGNAYVEGLSDAWKPIQAYWDNPSQANRNAVRSMLKPETTVWQYTHGARNQALISPDGYSLDNYYLARPGDDDVQLDLLLDYANNVMMYPRFQEYFRNAQPPLLAIWGRNDPFFLPSGAEAFKRDLPNARVRLIDAGHFAIETDADTIATAITEFLLS
jgi:pimeloyl-ACP methyl ester carboxylesterase